MPTPTRGSKVGLLARIRKKEREDKAKLVARVHMTTCRTKTIMHNARTFWRHLDLSLMDNGSPACMVTLKYLGNSRTWIQRVPDDKSFDAHIERLVDAHERDWGVPLRSLYFKEFDDRTAAPHAHLFVCPTIGVDRRGLTWNEWLEDAWAETTGQVGGFDMATGKGTLTWVPSAEEKPSHENIQEAYDAFERYEWLKYNDQTREYDIKVKQKRVPDVWLDAGVKRTSFYGATNMQEVVLYTATLACDCGRADFRNFVRRSVTSAAPDLRQIPMPDGTLHIIDVSRFSPDVPLRGGREYRHGTGNFVEAVMAIEAAHLNCWAVLPFSSLLELFPAEVARKMVADPSERRFTFEEDD